MVRDASLDEFLDGGESSHSRSDDEAEDAAGDSPALDEQDSEVMPEDGESTTESDEETPADSGVTSRWRPGSRPCTRCAASVERRWATDDGFVCSDCVSW